MRLNIYRKYRYNVRIIHPMTARHQEIPYFQNMVFLIKRCTKPQRWNASDKKTLAESFSIHYLPENKK